MHRAALLLSLATLLLPAMASAGERPVVVELFTSQGCSSCPPADAVLAELADRDDVLALAFHVDYWDRLGWVDPFSSAAATARQYDYAHLQGSTRVYTPQMMVDGATDVVGSNRGAVLAAITAAAGDAVVDLRLETGAADQLVLTMGPAPEGGTLWLVGFDHRHETEVRRGENAGRTLVDRNIVREIRRLDGWEGSTGPMTVTRPAGDTAAILLQAPDGRILGAARL